MKSITDLSRATLNASPGHRAVSHHVLGRPCSNIAFMTLAPAAFTYDACSRGGCETAGKAFMDADFTVRAARAPEMATQGSGKIQTLSLLVFFTGLTAAASPVVLSAEGNEAGNVQGAVRTSTRILATIEGHFDPRAKLFSWQQPCAPVP